jgi:hypothetical protein
MALARMLLRTNLIAASSEGNFTKQNGDLYVVSQRPDCDGRRTHARTVGENFQINALEDCKSFDFCETEGLVNLGESDHVFHCGRL